MANKRMCMTVMALGVLIVLSGGAARAYSLTSTTLSPAGECMDTGDMDKNENRILTLEVDHLPIVTDISPELTSPDLHAPFESLFVT